MQAEKKQLESKQQEIKKSVRNLKNITVLPGLLLDYALI
jgi:hypothetical protein